MAKSWMTLGTPSTWLRRWRHLPDEAPGSTFGPGGVDIDLSALESLPSVHWVTSRVDLPDAWRTQPDVRYKAVANSSRGGPTRQ